MAKIKLYIDTSVVSYLDQHDAPEKMKETIEFWKDVKNGKYEIITSATTIFEIQEATPIKRKILNNYLLQANCKIIENSIEIQNLANKIIEAEILTKKSYDDCIHIATAIISKCEYIISWNFKHMVNPKTVKGIRNLITKTEYPEIEIFTPASMLSKEE
jgi:predicted nucleic acid-binding protein